MVRQSQRSRCALQRIPLPKNRGRGLDRGRTIGESDKWHGITSTAAQITSRLRGAASAKNADRSAALLAPIRGAAQGKRVLHAVRGA